MTHASGVNNAFGLAGGAAAVQNVQRMIEWQLLKRQSSAVSSRQKFIIHHPVMMSI